LDACDVGFAAIALVDRVGQRQGGAIPHNHPVEVPRVIVVGIGDARLERDF
jgi:hypothetical protein